MTQDEIIEMARQAGIDVGIWEKLSNNDDVFGYSIGGIHENLEAFAKLVAAKEREACALIGDGYHDEEANCGDLIRARGQA